MPLTIWLFFFAFIATDLSWKCLASFTNKQQKAPETNALIHIPKNSEDEIRYVPDYKNNRVDTNNFQLNSALRELSRRGLDNNDGSNTFIGTDLILAITVDGVIHGINKKNGKIQWSQAELKAPLVSSQHDYLNSLAEQAENINDLDFIDPIDEKDKSKPDLEDLQFIPEPGNMESLYINYQGGLTKFPLSINTLIAKSPFRMHKRIYMANRRSNFVLIDPTTGKILRQSALIKSKTPFQDDFSILGKSNPFSGISRGILLGYVDYDIQVYDEDTEDLLWKISLRDYVPDTSNQCTDPDNLSDPFASFSSLPLEEFTAPLVHAFSVMREKRVGQEVHGSLVTASIPLEKVTDVYPERLDDLREKVFIGDLNGSYFALSPELYPYVSSPKFSSGSSQDLPYTLRESPMLTSQKQIDEGLVSIPPEEPKEGLFNFRRWLWLLAATLVILCGFQEVENHKLLKFVTETNNKKNKRKQQKDTDNNDVPKKGSLKINQASKSFVLEDGNTKINSIIITPIILGYGSHGTIVYKGLYRNRDIAVKRMLKDLVDVAEHEVNTLEDSDDHPNVIRYFAMEKCSQFMYLALELCPGSLHNLIDSKNTALTVTISPASICYQIISGIHHLHKLKLVHRDIKPQNILIASNKDRFGQPKETRILISDFGLCKRLEEDQSSFHHTHLSGGAAGTMGWRAPECLNSSDYQQFSNQATPTSSSSENEQSSDSFFILHNKAETPVVPSKGRMTRSIDIFSTGCVFFYVLTLGNHPFGPRFTRENRILDGKYDISQILNDTSIEFRFEAHDLIKRMIDSNPSNRPDSRAVLLHPYFWDHNKKLNFLQDISDQLEAESRTGYRGDEPLTPKIELGASEIIGEDWLKKMDGRVLSDLHKFRGYDGTKLKDLLRVVRNKKHHFSDLPPHVKRAYGSLPDGFLNYFLSRFPYLVLHAYYSLLEHPTLPRDPIFRPYFKIDLK